MAMKIKTLKDFILECVKRPGEEADIFEDECTSEVHRKVYALVPSSSTWSSPEPFRSAMNYLGFTDY